MYKEDGESEEIIIVARNRMRRASRKAKLRMRTRRMTPQKIMEEFGRMWDETLTKASFKK